MVPHFLCIFKGSWIIYEGGKICGLANFIPKFKSLKHTKNSFIRILPKFTLNISPNSPTPRLRGRLSFNINIMYVRDYSDGFQHNMPVRIINHKWRWSLSFYPWCTQHKRRLHTCCWEPSLSTGFDGHDRSPIHTPARARMSQYVHWKQRRGDISDMF